MNKYRIIPARIKLIKNNFTNRDIAELTGISENYISQIIHGRAITKKCAINIANITNFDFENLFEKL